MYVVVRHPKTLKFLKDDGQWTSRLKDCHKFESTWQATTFCDAQSLPDYQVTCLEMENGIEEVVLEVRDCRLQIR
jgi:hypothetical protein